MNFQPGLGAPGSLHARFPELGTGPLPVEPYVSPVWFAREKTYVFKKVWQHVGRVEEIPNQGDYLCIDLPASDASPRPGSSSDLQRPPVSRSPGSF